MYIYIDICVYIYRLYVCVNIYINEIICVYIYNHNIRVYSYIHSNQTQGFGMISDSELFVCAGIQPLVFLIRTNSQQKPNVETCADSDGNRGQQNYDRFWKTSISTWKIRTTHAHVCVYIYIYMYVYNIIHMKHVLEFVQATR